ncbi:MAG TPA: hypothetical protein EYP31_05665 [Roseibacterium sp.]|nr:hypothetical protein [Roseibacterium sp.]
MSDLLDLRYLVRLAFATVRDPKAGAAEILRIAPARGALWLAFALMIVVSLIMGEVVALILGQPEAGPLAGQTSLTLGLMQGAFLFVMVHAITQIGRICGGTGDFDGSLALITWLQFVFFLVQLLQLALLLVAPPIAVIVTGLAIGLFFWMLVNFILVLHGFASLSMVFFMTFASFLGILFTLSLVLSVLGLTPEPQGF